MEDNESRSEGRNRSYRGLKICFGATAILILKIAAVLVTLYFTVFKIKQPNIITRSVSLEHFKFELPTLFLNLTLGIQVTIDNKNYGGFEYGNSTAYVRYRGNVTGEAPIPGDTVLARRKHDINTSVTVFADKLLLDGDFYYDFIIVGILNFTSVSTLNGNASLLNLFKTKAAIFTTCDVSLYVLTNQAQSFCYSKVSF